MLDGYKVNIGDSVWDLLLGSGTVISKERDSAFTVQFGNYNTQRYTRNGYVGATMKRCYWQNPVIMIPPKDAHIWEAVRTNAIDTYKTFKKFLRLGLDKKDEADV